MKGNGYVVLVLASMATAMDSMGPMVESMMPMPTQSEASPMPPTSSSLLLPTNMTSSYEGMGSDSAMATGTAVSVPSDGPAPAATTSMAVDSSETETSSAGMAGMSSMSSMATVSTESMGHHMGTGGMMPHATATATATGQQPPISAGISLYPDSVGFCFASAVLGAVLVM